MQDLSAPSSPLQYAAAAVASTRERRWEQANPKSRRVPQQAATMSDPAQSKPTFVQASIDGPSAMPVMPRWGIPTPAGNLSAMFTAICRHGDLGRAFPYHGGHRTWPWKMRVNRQGGQPDNRSVRVSIADSCGSILVERPVLEHGPHDRIRNTGDEGCHEAAERQQANESAAARFCAASEPVRSLSARREDISGRSTVPIPRGGTPSGN